MKTTLPRPKKLVCVAIAHHVDDFGEGCYASYSTLAEETSYEERQVMRIVADVAPDAMAWQAAAAVGWLLALAPWVGRIGGIYLRPRADGRPG